MNRKRLAVTTAAVVASMAVLLGGTFAWQGIGQTALNEGSDIVNPGGRLHDDFDGANKDVYVENFAQEPIFARLQLGEFLALTNNKGVAGAEHQNVLVGSLDANGTRSYAVHRFDAGGRNPTDPWWSWETGGSTVFLPTFNKNKDSLAADVNGSYLGPDGIVTDRPDDDRYTDYVTYTVGQAVAGTEIWDADANDLDEVGTNFADLEAHAAQGSVVLRRAVHTAQNTLQAELIDMRDWLQLVQRDGGYDPQLHGGFWVCDTDGWVYWSAAIAPGTATGLLLDGIQLNAVMDDSWYYAIQVTAQFATADDIGKQNATGFYDPQGGSAPTAEAEQLLDLITNATLN